LEPLIRRIGFDDPQGGGIDDQNWFRDGLKQCAIPGFKLTQAGVVALHRLLRRNQTLLHRCKLTQVAPDGDHLPGGSCRDRRVHDWHIAALGGRVIHVPPLGRVVSRGSLQQCSHLGPTLNRDGFCPGLSDPLCGPEVGQFLVTDRNIADDALRIHQQRDVGCSSNQRCRIRRLKAGKRVFK
jgi:hypothetical protein